MTEGWTGRKCPHCKGKGERYSEILQNDTTCADCGGTGDEHAAIPDGEVDERERLTSEGLLVLLVEADEREHALRARLTALESEKATKDAALDCLGRQYKDRFDQVHELRAENAALKAEVAGLRRKLVETREWTIEDAAKECNAEAELAVEAICRQELAGEHSGVAREQTIGWEQGARRCAGRIRSLSTSQGEQER